MKQRNQRREAVRSLEANASLTPSTVWEALAQVAVIAAFWERLTSAERKRIRLAAERLVGLRDRRRDRRTGRLLGVYDAESELLDVDCQADGERYAVVCEEHGSIVHVSTLYAAARTGCLDFCDDCRAADQK